VVCTAAVTSNPEKATPDPEMKKTVLKTVVRIAAFAAACFVGSTFFSHTATAESLTRDLTFVLHRLRTLDHLTELEASPTAMSSTRDRSGGNLDGWDFKRVENGTNVLLEATCSFFVRGEPAGSLAPRGTK